MPVENWVTGNVTKQNQLRKDRVKAMMEKQKTKSFVSKVEPSVANKFFNLFSNKTPLPVGTFKRTKGGNRLANENLRALSYLSNRSRNTVNANLKTMKNKKNSKVLRKALNLTRRR
jgi:hypothetical protein